MYQYSGMRDVERADGTGAYIHHLGRRLGIYTNLVSALHGKGVTDSSSGKVADGSTARVINDAVRICLTSDRQKIKKKIKCKIKKKTTYTYTILCIILIYITRRALVISDRRYTNFERSE